MTSFLIKVLEKKKVENWPLLSQHRGWLINLLAIQHENYGTNSFTISKRVDSVINCARLTGSANWVDSLMNEVAIKRTIAKTPFGLRQEKHLITFMIA